MIKNRLTRNETMVMLTPAYFFPSLLSQITGEMLVRVSYNERRYTLKDVEAILRRCYPTL